MKLEHVSVALTCLLLVLECSEVKAKESRKKTRERANRIKEAIARAKQAQDTQANSLSHSQDSSSGSGTSIRQNVVKPVVNSTRNDVIPQAGTRSKSSRKGSSQIDCL